MAHKRITAKAKDTRRNILTAARVVFSRYAYNSASIRMIAAEGGFGHPIIGYYFPTKAELFETISEEICTDLEQSCLESLNEIQRMTPEDGFRLFIRRAVELRRQKPWIFKIIMLNIAQNRYTVLPGQEHLLKAVDNMRQAFVDLMGVDDPVEEVRRLTDSLNAMFLYYLGAGESASWLMGMPQNSPEYYEWVQNTIFELLMPVVGRLLYKPASRSAGQMAGPS